MARLVTGAPIVSRLGDATSPAVTDKTAYGSFETGGHGPGFVLTGLEAADPATGASQFAAFTGTNPTAPAVSNGTLYAAAGNTLYAFDATGTTNCGPPTPPLPNPFAGFSTLCNPLWTATLSGSVSGNAMPAVANGYVYVGDSTGNLYAFPAGGCGAATCSPAWTAQTDGAIESAAAATPFGVFVGSNDGKLYAFPAHGCGAATCQPLWTATTGSTVQSSPSVAGAVVYVGSSDGHLYAFNALGCGQTNCSPSLNANLGAPVTTSPAISNGQVFVTDTAGTLHAFGLPG